MKYEFKKLWHSKIIWIGLILITVVVIVTSRLLALIYKASVNYEDEYKSQVIELRERIADNASYFLEISNNDSDKIINRLNLKYYQRKLDLNNNENVSLGRMIAVLDNMYYADVISMLILVAMIVYLIISEHTKETYILNFSSIKGRWKLYFNKLSVIGICIVAIVIFEVIMFNVIAVISGNGISFIEKLQQSRYAMRSPYSLNYIQYLLCVMGMKILGYLAFASFIVFFTSIFTRIWVPLSCGIAYSIGRIITYVYFTENMANGRHLSKFVITVQKIMRNYTTMCFNFGPGYYLKEFRWNSIGDMPILSLGTVVISGIAATIIFVVCGGMVYSRRSNRC